MNEYSVYFSLLTGKEISTHVFAESSDGAAQIIEDQIKSGSVKIPGSIVMLLIPTAISCVSIMEKSADKK